MTNHYDVIIIGAGLSGIGAGYHLKQKCPEKSFLILEARERLGGTWDLFRYPGIRSDSDMYTMGYSFSPWLGEKALADGPSILQYINDVADDNDIRKHILCSHKAVEVSFSSVTCWWTLKTEHITNTGEKETVPFTCSFIFNCSGYYDYDGGYAPHFPDQERFKGLIVHPQKWPEDLDYRDKRVVIIGSGATAVTLLPAMAETARHVTMLQRTPTYIASVPLVDPVARLLHSLWFVPTGVAHFLIRWKNILGSILLFWQAKTFPDVTKKYLKYEVSNALGKDFDVDKHFSPPYNPWEQRLCAVPDGDFFEAIKNKKASIVTDQIDCFTETGIKLKGQSEELPADIIVTATGLVMKLFGGVKMFIDGAEMDMSKTRVYKGVMLSNIPNAAMTVGYTNATWTLKCDLTCEYVCSLLDYMDENNYKKCYPALDFKSNKEPEEPLLNLNSGYITRSARFFPKQGSKAPWKYYQNFLKDIRSLRYGRLLDGVMTFC